MSGDLEFAAVLLVVLAAVALVALIADSLAGRTPPRPARPRPRGGWCSPTTRPARPT